MSYEVEDDTVEQLIRRRVRANLEDMSQLAVRAAEIFDEDVDDCQAIVDDVLEEESAVSAGWPEVTDCDRLDRAFATLEAYGVLARHHFSCCSRCGTEEIVAEVHRAREDGRAIDGYVFYHWQDTDAALDGHGLYLRYQAMRGGPEETTAIGQRVVAALRASGLQPSWDGDPARAVELPTYEHKRRAPPMPYQPPVATAAESRARWCERIAELITGQLATALGDGFGEVAIALGDVALALAWARAHAIDFLPAPYTTDPSLRPRCLALGRVAQALRRAGKRDEARAVLDEAWRCVPERYARGALELLMVAELAGGADEDATALFELAERRVLDSPHDPRGAAPMAWLLARATVPNEVEVEWLERIAELCVHRRYDDDLNADRLAADAALWIIHARRGDAEETEAARGRVLDALAELDVQPFLKQPFAIRAVIAAAGAVGELAAIAGIIRDAADAQLPNLLDEHVWHAELDGLRALNLPADELDAQIARIAGDDPRVIAARARVCATALETYDYEFLFSFDHIEADRHGACLGRCAALARAGQLARARTELAAFARATAAALAAHQRRGRAQLDEDAPVVPVDERDLAAALATWEATPRGEWFEQRAACATILSAALALAPHDRARARMLIARAIHDEYIALQLRAVRSQLVAAWLATGQADEAIALVAKTWLHPASTVALARGLVALGRGDDALGPLAAAIERADTAEELIELAPAVRTLVSRPALPFGSAASPGDAGIVDDHGARAMRAALAAADDAQAALLALVG